MSTQASRPGRTSKPPRVAPGAAGKAPAAPTGAAPPYEAVIFDMDGVVTDTAALHAAAWKHLFDEVLSDPRAGNVTSQAPFDADADYRRFVDGRAREDGVVAFMSARGIDMPAGTPGDSFEAWTVHGLAERKNRVYLDLLAEHGVRVFDGTVALLRRLRAGGVATGLVTASRNAGSLLAAADLQGLFDVVVDGGLADDLNLAGKPEPAMFVEAARRLGVPPSRPRWWRTRWPGCRRLIAGGLRWWSASTVPGIAARSRKPAPIWCSRTSPNLTSGCFGRTHGCSSTRDSTRHMRGTGRP